MGTNRVSDFPQFFVAGTQKGGTSTIHFWLEQNPQTSLPSIKETHYFSNDEYFCKGVKWYLSWFRHGEEWLRGEVDPSIMFIEKALIRIREFSQTPRFIFIFREPLDRAYSHYRMSVQRGYENLDFISALEAEEERLASDSDGFSMWNHSYMYRGRYAEQLQRFEKYFPMSPKLYLRFDDLKTPPGREKVYGEICEFLGIGKYLHQVNLHGVKRPASRSRSPWLRDLIHGDNVLRRIGKMAVPSLKWRVILTNFLDDLNKKPVKGKSLKELELVPLKFRIQANQEIDLLSQITKISFHNWKHPV